MITRLLAPGILLGCMLSAAATARPQVAVGACLPNQTSVTTIQQAVDIIGPNGLISVCPGSYPEQVVISGKNLTLQGVSYGGSTASVITLPISNLVFTPDIDNAAYTIAAQILVTNATVTISGMTIDGSNAGIGGCGNDISGVLFQNGAGTVKNSNIINQALPPDLFGCQVGEGIYAEANTGTQAISLLQNVVRGFQKGGIVIDDAPVSAIINGNTVFGQGQTPVIAQNSIQIAFGATASIVGNTLGDDVYTGPTYGASGILVFDSPAVISSKNTVTGAQYPITYYEDAAGLSDSGSITDNRIDATRTFDAIDLCWAGNATVTGNIVSGADQSGIHLDSTCGGASTGSTVNNNRVAASCAGVLIGPGSAYSAATGNVFTTMGTAFLTGSDVCPVAASVANGRGGRALRPQPLWRR